MSRIRTIKPEFFTSADIVGLTPLARLFYVSLWCESDREGRLPWNPQTLKYRYLPADDCEVGDLASELIDADLIIIYEVDGDEYCEIPKFLKHQVINNREKESDIPARDEGAVTRASRVKAEGRKGREGKEGNGVDASRHPPCPIQEIVDLYHDALPDMPAVVKMTDKRAKILSARWGGSKNCQTLDWWAAYFQKVASSDFLMGKTAKPFHGCDFEWLITEGNFIKVVEGRYDNR